MPALLCASRTYYMGLLLNIANSTVSLLAIWRFGAEGIEAASFLLNRLLAETFLAQHTASDLDELEESIEHVAAR